MSSLTSYVLKEAIARPIMTHRFPALLTLVEDCKRGNLYSQSSSKSTCAALVSVSDKLAL